MKSGIYKITNIVNQKIYIGSAIDLNLRWSQHKYLLNRNKHNNTHLQRAFNKYSLQSFEFSIIEICEPSKLIEREQLWIDWFKPEYNKRKDASSNLGIKWSEETKLKISVSKTGVKQNPEVVKRRNENNRGKKRSDEFRKRISECRKGKSFSLEHRKNLSEAKRKPILNVILIDAAPTLEIKEKKVKKK